MSGSIFSSQDIRQMEERGITLDQAVQQIERFKKGMTFLQLIRPCILGDGIAALSDDDLERLSSIHESAALSGRAMKFVPASGAATRMFKSLMQVYNELVRYSSARMNSVINNEDLYSPLNQFINSLDRFAFYDDLKKVMKRDGLDIQTILRNKDHQEILKYVFSEKGLNLANLPKGLFKFHAYGDHSRTAFEEHLVEAAAYVLDINGIARIHFTVSPEHEEEIKNHFKEVLSRYEDLSTRFEISFSTQKRSTDTIAVDLENRPLRDREGKLIFRPGGHGALLENLNELKGDIVFIKNIDNVVPDRLKEETFIYKKALGGYLIELQDKVFQHLEILLSRACNQASLNDIMRFAAEELFITPPELIAKGSMDTLIDYFISKLNRPLRVCGMVKNEGEPGGGPFWVKRGPYDISLQIVESSQINMESEEQRAIWNSATHFNPVDIICAVRDYSGNPFHLMDYSDPKTGFITIKSKQGRKLKALELPGLWNGAMAEWNTVFVEVPMITFNPVKTVFDLLRKEHQSAG